MAREVIPIRLHFQKVVRVCHTGQTAGLPGTDNTKKTSSSILPLDVLSTMSLRPDHLAQYAFLSHETARTYKNNI
ncbi:hypothetical protein LP420_09120 [Massilia sp. B-10]|nr:hypothetical protein LP420_09120 [Massilia sp. B-10]